MTTLSREMTNEETVKALDAFYDALSTEAALRQKTKYFKNTRPAFGDCAPQEADSKEEVIAMMRPELNEWAAEAWGAHVDDCDEYDEPAGPHDAFIATELQLLTDELRDALVECDKYGGEL